MFSFFGWLMDVWICYFFICIAPICFIVLFILKIWWKIILIYMELFLIKFFNALMLFSIIAYYLEDIYKFVDFWLLVTGKWESSNTAQCLECWKDVNFCFLSPRVLLCPMVKRNVPALLISANVLASFVYFPVCLFLIMILLNSFYGYFEMIP